VAPDAWYQVRVEVSDEGAQTRIKAKVWADGGIEPGTFEIDCVDANLGRRTKGRIGVWSMNSGTKYWDDLNVTPL
jgi:hypothetical protein